jgi:outer membrane protein TolC
MGGAAGPAEARIIRPAIEQYQDGSLSIDDAIHTRRAARDAFAAYIDSEGALHKSRIEVLWASGGGAHSAGRAARGRGEVGALGEGVGGGSQET